MMNNAICVALCVWLIGCTEDSDDGLAVGAACERDSQCSGPNARCLTEGLYPLRELATSAEETARNLSNIGVPLHGGYCSSSKSCADDSDCGKGGTCFFPLRKTKPASLAALVGMAQLPADETEVLMSFLEYGQCMRACDASEDCPRDNYVCAVPLESFLSLVSNADMSTFCIGESSCDPNPCVHGNCLDGDPGTYTCTCAAGWEGSACDVNTDDCVSNDCAHDTCVDGVDGYHCDCARAPGWQGTLCDQAMSDCSDAPCLNGGACTDTSPGYACACADGWTGTHCENQVTPYCIATYALDVGNGDDGDNYTGCNMRIRDTPMSMGDGTLAMGPGTLILRFPSDGVGNPTAGVAEILYYHMVQEYQTSAVGLTVTTDVDAFSPTLGATSNAMAQATGVLSFDAVPTITWSACTYPDGYDADAMSFTPDVTGNGTGCLAPYQILGNVNCLDDSDVANCANAGLADGSNVRDETWEQALAPLTFTSDFGSFSMPFVLVPSRTNSRTYTSWSGTLTNFACE
ncbi:MAG: hypothetical protein A2341_10190 [Deltaproteobacteria bacterium RIFOXYB12_FULL_58_9]|nr:MAG: hypothetical protein A2341_10190 [Deltaproteobacteria bacterium RIFOXYB12_FULL_58_9]